MSSTTKYSMLGRPDSSRESLSLDQAERMSLAERLRYPGQRRGEKSFLLLQISAPWFVSLMLALTNVVLLVAFVKQQGGPARYIGAPKSWMPPEIETTELFEFKTLYGADLNNESEKAWNDLMPVGRGFVIVTNDTAIPDQPGLDQSLPEQKAMVSVFHQLHCIYMTREGYYSALAGRKSQVSSAHLTHCFDYLRQTVMCHGDTTLEWLPAPPNDTGSTGWGYEHRCRDFGAISRWVEANRLKTTHGIH